LFARYQPYTEKLGLAGWWMGEAGEGTGMVCGGCGRRTWGMVVSDSCWELLAWEELGTGMGLWCWEVIVNDGNKFVEVGC